MENKDTKADIYNGRWLWVWECEPYIMLSFPFCTVNIPKDCWEQVRAELRELSRSQIRKTHLPK